MSNSQALKRGIKSTSLHAVGVILVIAFAGPILMVLNGSFHIINDYSNFGQIRGITVINYVHMLQLSGMARWILNSLIVASSITVLIVVVDTLAAFAFAKLRFIGRNGLFMLLISTMMLPFSITLIPTYLLVSHYGLTNTYPGLILPALSGPLGVYLLRQFIRGIPDSLMEAARIDGASNFKIFLRIIAPLCVQPMSVLAIFTFVGTWNDFLWPLLVVQSEDMKTLTVGIATNTAEFYQNIGLTCAGSMISLIPMGIVFFAFQRYFLQGVISGAIKG